MLLLSLLLVLACTPAFESATLVFKPHSERVTDEYIVLYKKETGNDAIFAHQKALSRNIMHTYNISAGYRGFSAHLTQEELSVVLDNPYVQDVHYNGHVHTYCTIKQSPTTSWGLARVSHPGPLGGPLVYDFQHHPNAGQGTNVYILDTGVNQNHEQFNGRVAPGQNFVSGQPPANVDENGHGTHCAGTAAGNTYGIARNARIIPVKVLGRTGSGTWAGVIGGINWCANDYNQPNKIPSIASMSLGGGYDAAVNGAVTAAVEAGLPYAIAAGNSNADACNYSPASADGAICVGSTTMSGDDVTDLRSSFSNWGTCLTCFAPGTDIPSSYIPNANSYAVLSGTSMACPHVAGLGAVILGQNPGMTPPQLTDRLKSLANANVIQNPGAGSPNLLLHNGCTPTDF